MGTLETNNFVRMSVPMTPLRSLAICAMATAVVGCTKEATFFEPLPDYAAIHWVNAVPDACSGSVPVT